MSSGSSSSDDPGVTPILHPELEKAIGMVVKAYLKKHLSIKITGSTRYHNDSGSHEITEIRVDLYVNGEFIADAYWMP